MEEWSIQIDKEYLKFSAAHFLIFPDGTAERLHGHNYRVYVEIQANLSPHGLVLDFLQAKPVVRDLVDELDEHWIIPDQHSDLKHSLREDGVMEVRYKDRYYAAPSEDVLVLPINNTSAENLSAWLGGELVKRLEARFPKLELLGLEVKVEETPGQRGVWRFRNQT